MKFLLLLLVPIFSYKMPCFQCKYLKRDSTDIHYGKCVRFRVKDDFHYSYTARLWTHLCGKEGKYFRKIKNETRWKTVE
jgi:hypothetical protein